MCRTARTPPHTPNPHYLPHYSSPPSSLPPSPTWMEAIACRAILRGTRSISNRICPGRTYTWRGGEESGGEWRRKEEGERRGRGGGEEGEDLTGAHLHMEEGSRRMGGEGLGEGRGEGKRGRGG